MKSLWLNKVDKALRYLDYDENIIQMFSESEKEDLIRDEYLFLLRENAEDCIFSVDDMAQVIIDYKRRKLCTA